MIINKNKTDKNMNILYNFVYLGNSLKYPISITNDQKKKDIPLKNI